jgi:transcriptional regulator with XRE-family HTH domain
MNALRTWRREQGLTIETMAERLGVSVGSLSRIERNEQWPDRDFFERMASETCGAVTANDFVQAHAAQREPADMVNAGEAA